MTLLCFHPLEKGLDLCVVRMIAPNGDAHTTRCRDGLRDFIDRSGSGFGCGGCRPPGDVNARPLLSEHRSDAFADPAAGSGYYCDFADKRRKAAHDSDIQIRGCSCKPLKKTESRSFFKSPRARSEGSPVQNAQSHLYA